MRLALRWAGLALTLALALPVIAADYGGYGKKSADKADKQDPKEKLRTTGKLQGNLVSVDSSLKSFTLQAKWVTVVQNADEARAILDLTKQLNNTTDVNSRRNLAIEIAKHRKNLYSYEEKKQNFDLQAIDDVNVRWKTPPPAFDNNGKQRKHTLKELDELRGPDKKLPGYTAEFADLRPNMTVEITVAKKDGKAAKEKDKDPDKEKEQPVDRKGQVTMIMIVGMPPK